MSEKIVLKSTNEKGQALEAVFETTQGVNLISFKKEQLEVIDPSSGSLIGPHFGSRHVIPSIKEASFQQHIEELKKHHQDPFYNGVARYAPWKILSTKDNLFTATLISKDTWKEATLTNLEGQVFVMHYTAELNSQGLAVSLSVVSDADSVVGTDFRFKLPEGQGKVISDVKEIALRSGKEEPLPHNLKNDTHTMVWDLANPCEYIFHPFTNPVSGKIILETESYSLETVYKSRNQENSWQLKREKDASYVSINPLSAKNPWFPNLTVSSIDIQFTIL